MENNKVVLSDGTVLIDISDSTLTAEDLLEGLIAYNKAGERIIGRMAQIIVDTAMSDTSGNAVQNKVIKAYTDEKAARAQADAQAYADLRLATKQDKLTSGTNIKTVNGNSLLGSGDLVIPNGMNLEVGVEKWYGTYREGNVTYQVYTKVVKIDALPDVAGITTYEHGISGIRQILGVYGFGTNGFVLNAPRQNAQDNIAIYQVSKSASNQTFSIEVGKNRSSMGAYVCLIYAKNN